MGSHSSCALIKPRASTIHQIVKELLPFSTGSSVMSLRYRFIFVLAITFLRGLLLILIGYKGSLDQDTRP
jgi:hypothetical protein